MSRGITWWGKRGQSQSCYHFHWQSSRGRKLVEKLTFLLTKNDFTLSTNYKLLIQIKENSINVFFKSIISVMDGHSHIVKTTTPSEISRPVIFTDSLRIYSLISHSSNSGDNLYQCMLKNTNNLSKLRKLGKRTTT